MDLMFSACGETYESLLPHVVTLDFDGVPVRTLDLEGLLKTKQTMRDKARPRDSRARAGRTETSPLELAVRAPRRIAA